MTLLLCRDPPSSPCRWRYPCVMLSVKCPLHPCVMLAVKVSYISTLRLFGLFFYLAMFILYFLRNLNHFPSLEPSSLQRNPLNRLHRKSFHSINSTTSPYKIFLLFATSATGSMSLKRTSSLRYQTLLYSTNMAPSRRSEVWGDAQPYRHLLHPRLYEWFQHNNLIFSIPLHPSPLFTHSNFQI